MGWRILSQEVDMAKQSKSAPRKLKGQTSLFRTHSEAGQMIRAAEGLLELKERTKVVTYKRGHFGAKIGSTVITNVLPHEEAEMIVQQFRDLCDKGAITLAHKAEEVHKGIVLRVSEIAKPDKGGRKIVDGSEPESEARSES
jgi:hypothetical protein